MSSDKPLNPLDELLNSSNELFPAAAESRVKTNNLRHPPGLPHEEYRDEDEIRAVQESDLAEASLSILRASIKAKLADPEVLKKGKLKLWLDELADECRAQIGWTELALGTRPAQYRALVLRIVRANWPTIEAELKMRGYTVETREKETAIEYQQITW
jgi:hypothetical protein